MEFLTIAKAIGELGFMAITCAIFLWQTHNKDKKNAEFTEQLFKCQLQQNQTFLNKILDASGGPHVLTEEEDRQASMIDKTIDFYLQQTVIETGATRASVMRYHNGGRDMTGISFLKMSMTNEVVNVGVSPIMTDFQNQFRSIMSIFCEELDQTGSVNLEDLETIKHKDYGTYELLKTRNARSLYCKALYNSNGYIIGCVGISFKKDNVNTIDKEKAMAILEEKSKNISSILNLVKTQ